MAGFEDLEVWKRAVALSVAVYRRLSECRDFGFKDQVTRSALSVASNIAEGMERSSVADKTRFLNYARGSSAEFRTQVMVGREVGFIDCEISKSWIKESRELSAMIQGLIKSIQTEY